MLEAISATTLLDDVMQEDPTTNNLESFLAELTGKDAALLVMSGTMGRWDMIHAMVAVIAHGYDPMGHLYIYPHNAAACLRMSNALTHTCTFQQCSGMTVFKTCMFGPATLLTDYHHRQSSRHSLSPPGTAA